MTKQTEVRLEARSLTGLKVLDITTSVAGPFATMVLGDLGADVIKIERPGTGDDTRRWGPPFWNDESAHFLSWNRNKRSVEVDYTTPDGRAVLMDLVRDADVLVQNLRHGVLSARGFGWEHLHTVNPGLIYCSIGGFGSTGPLASKGAYDPLLQAFAGLMAMTGEDGRPPARIPVSVLDQGTAMWAVIGVLDALRRRTETGAGTLVETSLLSTALMWQPAHIAGYLASGEMPERLGSGAIGIAPYGAYPTQDGYVMLAAGNQGLWETTCKAIGHSELCEDSRFLSNELRVMSRVELDDSLATVLRTRSTREWVEILDKVGVPCSPIQQLDEVLNHEQVRAAKMVVSVDHPKIRDYAAVALPIEFDGVRPGIRFPAPSLGEHNEQANWASNEG
jgi:crotonobetainyl-CoA:carnitine CoA-transferase CaiB-like acyl-CoA transferase